MGTYNSIYSSLDIADQAFSNPAGRYDYTQLLQQAMSQTYVITDLFNNTDVPESLFSIFLPNDTMPSIDFLSATPPTDPNSGGGGAASLALSGSFMLVLVYSILAFLILIP